ncbi:Salicylate hydroxylase [Madurella mycetomatis]|uniref:Salicylate hydroxylase n=1 Tax=Madurella mycetomatis TaxID=100816 RepID=A0A175VZU3_9PEZI|nr:Salicylate hydroxylase [Madurella mycetomatis]
MSQVGPFTSALRFNQHSAMNSTSRTISVAIVGGGIAGLALAAGLIKKPHLEVHVYEAVAAYRDVGAGLALHHNALEAMGLIGPEVRQAYLNKAISIASEEDEVIVTEVCIAQGPHAGDLVAELGRAKGRKSVSRADLLKGLLALISPDRISFSKRLWKVHPHPDSTSKIHLEFSDNSFASADCVLGADGVHSVIRCHLLGPSHPATTPKNHDRWQIYRTLVTSDFARQYIDDKFTRTVPILLGPRGHVNCIPLNKGSRLSAGIAIRGAAPPTSHDKSDWPTPPPTLDPSQYKDYHPEAQRIISLIALDPSASWQALDHDRAPYYSRGKIAMLGDAAHTALPFAGNGAGQALEDAAVLNRLFDEVREDEHIALALEAYNTVRLARTQRVVELARMFGRVFAFAQEGIGADPDKIGGFLKDAGEYMNEYDVRGAAEGAVEVLSLLRRERQGGMAEDLERDPRRA